MKLAVVGSRQWAMRYQIWKVLDDLCPDEIVSGGAEGPDKVAEYWAYVHRVPAKIFLPDWSIGKRAGAIRNQKIVDYCDELIAFWDGTSKGTAITMDMAAKANKLMKVYKE